MAFAGACLMARMGGQVQIAQCIGRGEKEKGTWIAQTAMQLALLMGLAYGIIVALFANQLVGIFQAGGCGNIESCVGLH